MILNRFRFYDSFDIYNKSAKSISEVKPSKHDISEQLSVNSVFLEIGEIGPSLLASSSRRNLQGILVFIHRVHLSKHLLAF
ncbi:hypothetical protein CTZ29_04130 [Bacillus halotolerans]|nr:hypothetical protein CTZ29_04130 [Bacillus halotolerans]